MKRYFRTILCFAFIITLVFFVYEITSKIIYKDMVAKNIKTIPEFSYQNINGDFFNNQNLKTNTPIIFIYFNTECEYCNEETQLIKENIVGLKKFQLIFISLEKAEVIQKFAKNHQLTNYDNVHFLCDSKVTFANTFDVSSIPCIILYDKNHKLIEKLKGQTKPEILIKKLNTK